MLEKSILIFKWNSTIIAYTGRTIYTLIILSAVSASLGLSLETYTDYLSIKLLRENDIILVWHIKTFLHLRRLTMYLILG